MAITLFRSLRFNNQKSINPSNIGPGSYDYISSNFPESHAPFNCHGYKDIPLKNKIPGPGSYEINRPSTTSIQPRTSSFKSAVPRFINKNLNQTDISFVNQDRNNNSLIQLKTYTKFIKQPEMIRLKVPPSIPFKKVRKNMFKGEGKDCIGPDRYFPLPIKMSIKGAPFSSSKENRTLFLNNSKKENAIGPGSYAQSKLPSKVNFNLIGSSAFIKDLIDKKTLTKPPNPGPGSYSPFQKGMTDNSAIKKQIRPESKDSASRVLSIYSRDHWVRNINAPYNDPLKDRAPGPGYYLKERRNPTKKIIQTPLTINYLRSKKENTNKTQKIYETPGPGTYYDQKNPIYSLAYKDDAKYVREKDVSKSNAAFGTSSMRFHLKNLQNNDPGPGQYEEDAKKKEEIQKLLDDLFTQEEKAQSYIFSSKTDRFNKPKNNNVIKNENTNQRNDQRETIIGDNDWVREVRNPVISKKLVGKYGFNAGETRFKINKKLSTSIGPGHYNTELMKIDRNRVSTAASKTNSTRPHTVKVDHKHKLGPGSYKIEKSLLKKTFNMSIENFSY